MTADEKDIEIARLRHEAEALNEQVKLLVRTEQRLYRAQGALDSQLERMHALARFAGERSATEAPAAVIESACELVAETLRPDWVGIARIEPAAGVVVARSTRPAGSAGVAEPLDEPALRWCAALAEPLVEDAGGATPAPVAALVRRLWPQATWLDGLAAAGVLACVPLRASSGALVGVLLVHVRDRRRAVPARELVVERHVPFLHLLAHHVGRAIETAVLTEDLRVRSDELAASLERLEETQQELLQAQKMEAIGRLAGGIAHDFNNLLTVILGYASTLRETLGAAHPQQGNVHNIQEAARRAAAITRQLLALSRRQLLRREQVAPNELVEKTLALLHNIIGEHIQVELQLDPATLAVWADRSQLEQVLLNLVVNARDAMPQGGTLTVTTRNTTAADQERAGLAPEAGVFTVVEVRDTGTGMDDLTRARIFEPFFTTKPAGQGSGLGLAVVYGIVRQSDGRMYVDSAPGQGTRFVVLLPASEQAVAAAAEGPPAARPVRRGVVLVVEDEPAIRSVVRGALAAAGHVVHEAGDGVQALTEVRDRGLRPDLLVTDVVMPRMGGIRLAEELRRMLPELRVLFMSGYSADLVERERATGPHAAFLAKPFMPEALQHHAALLLAQGSAPRARARI